jgi:hypothetical protein
MRRKFLSGDMDIELEGAAPQFMAIVFGNGREPQGGIEVKAFLKTVGGDNKMIQFFYHNDILNQKI